MKTLLTLDELKEVTDVYAGFQTIEKCNLPDYYRDVFPKKCECGGEMIMTEPGHTQLQCCNPNCWIKAGHRLSYFIAELGYKGFGEQSALTLVLRSKDQFKYPTFLSAFLLSDEVIQNCLTDHLANLFIDIRDDLKTRTLAFKDAVAALGIPGVGSRSSLFDVVKSPVLLLQIIQQDKLDMACDAAGIWAPMTRYQLNTFKLDLVTLMLDVTPGIVNTPDSEIYVAITGKVHLGGEYYTRQEFLAKCNSITDESGNAVFKLVETKAESKLDYVVADVPSNSEKYNLGKKLGILISAEDLYSILLSKAKDKASKDSSALEENKETESVVNCTGEEGLTDE